MPTEKREHEIHVIKRGFMSVSGVDEVLSFDENSVLLSTTGGTMSVEGRELKVNVLDVKEGNVSVDGHIDSIYYSDTEPDDRSHGFLGRLFH